MGFLRKGLFSLLVLSGAATHSASSYAQTSVEDVLENVFGTYTLTFDLDPGPDVVSPIADGAQLDFVVAPANHLCTDDLSLSSATLLGSPVTAVSWQNALSDVRFDVRLTDTDPDPDDTNYVFANIQFRNAAGELLGVFTLADPGDYTNSTGSCGASSDPTDAQINSLLDNAETAFPALFPAGPFTFTQKSGAYTYRYYDSTEINLAVSAGQVYARGGGYGSSYQSVGSFQSLSNNINNIARPASINNFFVGTYDAEMTDTQPFSTIPDGAAFQYAITDSGQLCLSNGTTISNPLYLNNNTAIPVWRDDAANLSYRLDLSDVDDIDELDGSEVLLQVYSGSGIRFGELSGVRISLNAFCETIDPTHPDTLIMAEIEQLFVLAEQLYPEYLAFGPTVSTQRTADYTFRYYPISDVFVAVRDGMVYAGSGMPDFSEPTLGTLNQVFAMLGESTRDFAPPASLVGTYDVLVSGANPLFRLPNNSRVRLVIAASGALCIDNITLTGPMALRAAPDQVSWTNMLAGINAAMVVSNQPGPVTLSLVSTRGESLATLSGDRVNLLATCPQPVMSALEIDTANELFVLAERRYPDLFSNNTNAVTRSTGGALTRYYPATDITVSVSLNEVFVRGGDFGASDYFVGSVGNLIAELRASPSDQPASLPSALTGTYSMLVSGANPFAPFANNSEVRMVISANGDLCLNNSFINDPRSSYSAPDVARWSYAAGSYVATLDTQQAGNLLSLTLTSNAGNSLGTLTGSRISGETFCSGTPLNADSLQQANTFLALAEQRYPEYFPAAAMNSTREAGGALIRQYTATGVSITVVNGQVYIRGSDFGTADFYAGTTATLTTQWHADLNQQGSAAPLLVQVNGTATVIVGGLNSLTRQINETKTKSYAPSQLTDAALEALATDLLSGEIQSPDSINIFNIARTGGSLSFSVQMAKTSVLGANASQRYISATISLLPQ